MPKLIQPVVSPRGRVIVLSGATLWLIVAMVLSAAPNGVSAAPRILDIPTSVVETSVIDQTQEIYGAPGLLLNPRLHADSRGIVYVSDFGGHRVIRLVEDQGFSAEVVFGRQGAGPGEMQRPYDVAIDSHGNVFVTDLQLQRISKFAADGSFVKSVAVPNASSVEIDSHDNLIVFPGPDNALLQRFDNDLNAGETLLEKTDARLHRSFLGVIIAIDHNDRLYVFDQSDLVLTVYDGAMNVVDEWSVEAPGLREGIAFRQQRALKKINGASRRINGVQSMSLDGNGEHLMFAYLIEAPLDSEEEMVTQVASFDVAGNYEWTEIRGDTLYASVQLGTNLFMEGTPEMIRVRIRGSQPTTTSNDN